MPAARRGATRNGCHGDRRIRVPGSLRPTVASDFRMANELSYKPYAILPQQAHSAGSNLTGRSATRDRGKRRHQLSLRIRVAAPELRSSAKDLLARAWEGITELVDSSIWWAIAVFLIATALCGLSMIAFSLLSNVFKDAGIPLLGNLMTIMFWLMGLVLIMVVAFGKWVIIFRG